MPKAPNQIALSAKSRKTDPKRAEERAAARGDDGGDSERTARLAGRAALEKKAGDVLLLDLRGLSGYADFLVLSSGGNERQLDAVADGVEKAMKEAGHRLVGAEGQHSARWQLLDFGDVVVHVFHEEERHHYDLEGLWADAPRERMHEEAAPREGASAPGSASV